MKSLIFNIWIFHTHSLLDSYWILLILQISIYICMYIYMCVCVCVCVFVKAEIILKVNFIKYDRQGSYIQCFSQNISCWWVRCYKYRRKWHQNWLIFFFFAVVRVLFNINANYKECKLQFEMQKFLVFLRNTLSFK